VSNSFTAGLWSRLSARMVIAGICVISGSVVASAQVRSKSPDRGTYKAPVLKNAGKTVARHSVLTQGGTRVSDYDDAYVQQASFEQPVVLRSRKQSRHPVEQTNYATVEPMGGLSVYESSCDSFGGCNGCGACDCAGGCSPCLSNGRISCSPSLWFGRLELLSMDRNGDFLPPLVTSGPSTNADTAGQLDQAATRILFGEDTVLDTTTAGGRVTFGTYLDSSECRSLVFRGWYGGRDKFGFAASGNNIPVLARPFNNVSGGQASTPDTQLVAFPNRNDGSIRINGESEVYGGDISIRQFYYQSLGFKLDVLYGYQHMGLMESVDIRGITTSLDDAIAPLGSVISIDDSFEVSNTFNGGQLGLAGSYREGCWSFDILAKTAFGSLRRTADLRGQTRTNIDAAVAIDDQGLLVRDTNSGKSKDSTFGWVPELDFSLGYHRFPNYDLTIGYHIIAMTDALRPGATIDDSLRSNLSSPLVGQASPTRSFQYETFYVHGIHIGISHMF
jgi:Putative beta barrel porin-7 (BBP7)